MFRKTLVTNNKNEKKKQKNRKTQEDRKLKEMIICCDEKLKFYAQIVTKTKAIHPVEEVCKEKKYKKILKSNRHDLWLTPFS